MLMYGMHELSSVGSCSDLHGLHFIVLVDAHLLYLYKVDGFARSICLLSGSRIDSFCLASIPSWTLHFEFDEI